MTGYVVVGENGHYDMHSIWNVFCFLNKQKAEEYIIILEKKLKELYEKYPVKKYSPDYNRARLIEREMWEVDPNFEGSAIYTDDKPNTYWSITEIEIKE